PHDVNILPLIKTSDVVRLPYLSFMENLIYGNGMVYHIEPVPYIFPFSVNWERLVVFNIVDTEWNQLLWKLVRSVVIGAIADHRVHLVGVGISPYKVVRRSLGG